MAIRILTPSDDPAPYEHWLASHPHATVWQSSQWCRFQKALGREIRIYVDEADGKILTYALVVIDRTVFGLSAWDVPRGPLGDANPLLGQIVADAKKDNALSVYLSPITELRSSNFELRTSSRHEQPEATVIVDLTKTEEEMLAQMHQKGRYNIRLAEKHGITVEESKDVDAWYALASETGKRDGFGILPKKHYQAFLETLDGSFLLLAKRPDGKVVAGLVGLTWNGTGIYYYGASSYEDRALMAPYLLQWEAIKRCKAAGCTTYDLLGIAPLDQPNHPWNSISDFKKKFGGKVIEYPREKMIVLQPVKKRLIDIKRAIVG